MVLSFLMLVLLWIVFTRSTDPYVLLIGVVAAGGVTVVKRHLFPSLNPLSLALLYRPHRLIVFFATLLVRFVLSTMHTCRLILLGRQEGRIVALPIRINNPFGQFILLNSITLTPSTISLLLEGDLLYIHWLRAKGSAGDWRTIKESLERTLLPIFERGVDAPR